MNTDWLNSIQKHQITKRTRNDPVPERLWTVVLRFSLRTLLLAPKASFALSSAKEASPPIAAYSCTQQTTEIGNTVDESCPVFGDELRERGTLADRGIFLPTINECLHDESWLVLYPELCERGVSTYRSTVLRSELEETRKHSR